MADYSNYTGLQSAQQRRDASLSRLQAMGQARSRYMAEQQAKAEAERQKAIEKAEAAQREGGRNWLSMAGQGAALGSMAGPGYGTLIGGIIGAGAGLLGSAASRQHENGGGAGGFIKGLGQSLVHPVGDKFDGMSDIPLGGLVAAGVGAGRAAGLGQSGPQPGQNGGPMSQGEYDAAFLQAQDPSLMGSSGGYGKAPSYGSPAQDYGTAQQNYLDSIYMADDPTMEMDTPQPAYRQKDARLY